jgi:hypothetical protein
VSIPAFSVRRVFDQCESIPPIDFHDNIEALRHFSAASESHMGHRAANLNVKRLFASDELLAGFVRTDDAELPLVYQDFSRPRP